MSSFRKRKSAFIKSIAVIFLFAFLGYFVQAETVVEFDSVEVNQSQEKIIRLSNSGNMVLKIDKIYLEDETGEFSIDCDSSLSIEGGESTDITVKFAPRSGGDKKATINIESNDPERENEKILLTGRGLEQTTAIGAFGNGQPEKFNLAQNYPNPFNSSTTFKFQIAKSEQVKITIYSITGQKIKTIKNRAMEPGYYEVRWKGTNSYGQKVSSGLYLARMIAGNFSKKIMLTYAK
jgi:hypothetical protein